MPLIGEKAEVDNHIMDLRRGVRGGRAKILDGLAIVGTVRSDRLSSLLANFPKHRQFYVFCFIGLEFKHYWDDSFGFLMLGCLIPLFQRNVPLVHLHCNTMSHPAHILWMNCCMTRGVQFAVVLKQIFAGRAAMSVGFATLFSVDVALTLLQFCTVQDSLRLYPGNIMYRQLFASTRVDVVLPVLWYIDGISAIVHIFWILASKVLTSRFCQATRVCTAKI